MRPRFLKEPTMMDNLIKAGIIIGSAISLGGFLLMLIILVMALP